MRFVPATVSFAVFVCGGCEQPPWNGEKLDLARAESDAATAMAKGDGHLLGVAGYSIVVPGFEQNYAEAKKHGVRVIAGTSDDSMYEGYQKQATEYATIFNRTIAELAKTKP